MMSNLGTRFVYRNPLDLPRISYSEIVANTAEGVYVEEPRAPRIFHRAAPAFHDDPDGAGVFPPFHDLTVTYPPVFTVSVRQATLVGYRSVLSPDGFFVNDLGHLTTEDAAGFAQGLPRLNETGALLPTRDDGWFGLDLEGVATTHLEGPVVVLSSAEPGNFGSFLYREIIKTLNLVEIPANWRFLAHMPLKPYEQFLELADLPMERIVRHDLRAIYRIDQAIIPGLRSPYAFADPQVRAFYARLREKCDTGGRGRRIYVSRRSTSAAHPKGRVMLNETELIARLQPMGFDIVEPQYLTATEQVAAFASADFVVGPSGAGMFNAVFCRPQTKLIDIESEPHWIYPHTSLFASTGLEYGIFEGKAVDRDWSTHHKPWRVNIEALLQRIASFAPRDGSSSTDAQQADTAPFWAIPDLGGEDYTVVLGRFHRVFNPRTYLEIGVANGASLALANCPSIGVDPHFSIDRPVLGEKPMCCFYKRTADQFFSEFNPSAILGRPVDVAFLDGFHWYEFLLRDFINTEQHCKPNSIIFLHDCLPTDEYVGRRDLDDHRLRARSAHPGWWAGDVWKIIPILSKLRPDLRIVTLNADPTGLVAVTRLDPSSRLLADQYYDVVEAYRSQTLAEEGKACFESLNILDTRQYASLSALSSLFHI